MPEDSETQNLNWLPEEQTRWAAAGHVDPFFELSTPPTADHREAKKAYVVEARKHHPDKGGDLAKMQRVVIGWELVATPLRLEQCIKRMYAVRMRRTGDLEGMLKLFKQRAAPSGQEVATFRQGRCVHLV